MKRPFDILVAAMGLVLFSPLLAVVALIVLWDVGWPVWFRQRRVGYRGRLFTLIKFRTMRAALDASGSPLPDGARLTRVGQWLRASSLDELPELWNVLVGEMSLVGPRPLLPEYLPLYTPREQTRHDVRPGLTGWAQVNGRNALDWDQRLELDAWYVEQRTLWLDLKILAMTALRVVQRDGISQAGHATMPSLAEQRGSRQDEPTSSEARRAA